jgi:hypothetical protein
VGVSPALMDPPCQNSSCPACSPHALPKFVMAGLVRACPGHPHSVVPGSKDVDGRDIGAKQSFVASPGHDGGLTLCSVERP